VSPDRRHKRLYQRRSVKTSKNYLPQRTFKENIRNFAARLKNRGYPAAIVEKHLLEVIFHFPERKTSVQNRNRTARKKILPFVTQYHPALPNLKEILMALDTEPTATTEYRKGKSLTDILVKAKL